MHTEVNGRPMGRNRSAGTMEPGFRGLDRDPTLRFPSGPAVIRPHHKGRTHDCKRPSLPNANFLARPGAIHTWLERVGRLAEEKMHTEVTGRPMGRNRSAGTMEPGFRGLDRDPTLRFPSGPAVIRPHHKGRTHDCK